MNVDELSLTKLLVYGTYTPGEDPNTHIRPNNAPAPIQYYKMSDYLDVTTGQGRYARPSSAPLVKEFFADSKSDDPKLKSNTTYSAAQLRKALGIDNKNDLKFDVSNYDTGGGDSDFLERSYVFGGSGFFLKDNLNFKVDKKGVYTILNVEVIAKEDDFDYQSSNGDASVANIALSAAFDPYGLIPDNFRSGGIDTTGVRLVYTGGGRKYADYTETDFKTDTAFFTRATSDLSYVIGKAKFVKALVELESNIGYLGRINSDNNFKYYTDDGKKIVYGTNNDDTIDEFPHVGGSKIGPEKHAFDIYVEFQMVGGKGKDQITGGIFSDELWGGEGNDTLNGRLGDDDFIGGLGDDQIEGGSFAFGLFEGEDVARYTGPSTQYKIEFLPDETVRITDKVGRRDGVDTLEGVEFAQFSDKKVDLRPGQDIAFVIDTTGSMYDDIDAVKAQSASIIDAIFDPDRGSLNSHVAVVGYNDPYTETFLSFTEQADPEDRKDAAIAAIDSISVGGGGDIPEAVNAGLLRALTGGAGEWRKDAVARKIVLFGDAPPNDPELAGQVRKLAADLGVVVPTAVSSSALSSNLYLTTFSVASAAASAPVPVQIFTVVIGDDSETIEAFESLAADTKGASFSASGADDIVDVLIDVIQTPIYKVEVDPTSIIEGNSGTGRVIVTVSRDVGEGAATVTLERFGTSNVDDATNLPTRVTFADGQTSKAFAISVKGDTAGEADETYGVRIVGVDKPATIATETAEFSILNDDARTNVPTRGSDNLVGTSGSDRIDALAGNDKVAGRAGNDTLIGNSGNDRLLGEAGSDKLFGGNGRDNLSGDAGNDVLRGNASNDKLNGGNGRDSLSGDAGNDVLRGNASNDKLYGGSGKDNLSGDAGNDALRGNAGNDKLNGGSGKDSLSGDAGNDVLRGNAGNDKLMGGSGKDQLFGAIGADKLTGGGDADTFRFEGLSVSKVASNERDTIIDFSRGQHDRIHLSSIDANSKAGGNQAFHFIDDDAFGHQAGELQARFDGSNTLVTGDVNGDAKADFAILVRGHVVLHAGDFFL